MFFVSAGIFVGLVVFGNTIARKKIDPAPKKQDFSNTADITDSLKNPIGEEAPLPAEDTPITTPAKASTPDASTNLTQNLASLIGKSIVDKNPEGPAGDNLNVVGADSMADQAVEESMSHFNPSFFSPEIPQSEITIDNSQTSTTYHAAAAKIIMDSESLPPPPAGDPVATKMKTLAKRYEDEYSALRSLPVPQSLATEHIKALRIALGRERILEAVADYENDPIYAMLALKLWDTLK